MLIFSKHSFFLFFIMEILGNNNTWNYNKFFVFKLFYSFEIFWFRLIKIKYQICLSKIDIQKHWKKDQIILFEIKTIFSVSFSCWIIKYNFHYLSLIKTSSRNKQVNILFKIRILNIRHGCVHHQNVIEKKKKKKIFVFSLLQYTLWKQMNRGHYRPKRSSLIEKLDWW